MSKRLFDFLGALVLLAILLPVLLVVALCVRIAMGSPVFFVQERPGLSERPFRLVKFRTMVPASTDGATDTDAERLTSFGRWLRATSLDELPELLNVLKGEMSLVGPRPLLMEYLPLYTARQARRHEVRPGVTGWAQINGRNAISWEERLELDVWYVEHRSIWLDFAIFLATPWVVLRSRGITQRGQATVERFTGGATDTPPRRTDSVNRG